MNLIPLNQQSSSLDPTLIPLRNLLLSYAKTPSPSLAGRIAEYVENLLENREFRVPPSERCNYQHMRVYWRLVEKLG